MDLSQYGFDASVERFNDYLKGASLWAGHYNTSSAQAFVKMYGWTGESIKFEIEELVRDLKYGTSKSLQSVIEHVKVVGYKAKRKYSSTMTVNFTTAEALPYDIVIPKWTRIQINDIVFVTVSSITLISGSVLVEADVIQGYRESFSFVADGTSDLELDIIIDNIEEESTEVFVEGTLWTEIDDYNETEPLDEVYEEWTIYGGVRLVFGDGIYGKIPVVNASVDVSVLISDGSEGNITDAAITGTILDIVYAPDGSRATLAVISATSAENGADEQGVRQIKRAVPAHSTSGGVYKRDSELKALFESFSFVDQANIFTEPQKDESIRDMRLANIINIFIVPVEGYIVNLSFKENMMNQIIEDELVLSTQAFNIAEADYIYFRHSVEIEVPSKGVSPSSKENQALERLRALYETYELGDSLVQHTIEQAMGEYTEDDGENYLRDKDILNLRNTTKVVILKSQMEDWHSNDGFEKDLDYDTLTENGAFTEDEANDDDDLWQYHHQESILKKFPITEFQIEADGVVVVDMATQGTFKNEYVQGSINFSTGEYSITISEDADDVIAIYAYSDIDIPMDPNEYPRMYGSQDIVATVRSS